MPTTWHLITGEYPPQSGGVSEYTQALAQALVQRNASVHVWAPGQENIASTDAFGICVHRLEYGFGPRGLLRLSREMNALPQPRRILVQYVPHALGLQSMNVPFCLWVATRSERVWLMMHEVAVPWGRGFPVRLKVLGAVHRGMAWLLTRRAESIFVSTPAWARVLRPYLPRRAPAPTWLPIPSSLPDEMPVEAKAPFVELRKGRALVIGHFGTYGPAVAQLLMESVPPLLSSEPRRALLLVGVHSESFASAFAIRHPELKNQIICLGKLSAPEAACALGVCDLVLQPYPDGITARRSSAMAGLALGLPLVTNEGPLSEPLWADSGAVALAHSLKDLPRVAEGLIRDEVRRTTLGQRGKALYRSHFSLERTVQTLLTLAEHEDAAR